MSFTQYNENQLNAISVMTSKYEYLSSILRALAGVTEQLTSLHRQRLENGWSPSDAIMAESLDLEWKALKMKYLEAMEDNTDLNNSMFLSRVEMWMN